MEYVQIKADMQSENPIQLNTFLGSTVRGAIISEISKMYCTQKESDCASCQCGVTCPNKILFNMKEFMSDGIISNTIVINAKEVDGQNITLDIKLFGIGIMSTETIKDALTSGIKLGKERETFKALNVTSKLLKTSNRVSDDTNRISVIFKSPMYIQRECKELSFEDILKSCMYRYMSINKVTNSEPRIEFEELKEKAQGVKLVERHTRHVQLARYSHRTNTKHDLSCVTGKLVFEGDFKPFMNILNFVTYFNIGKWCSMGLGNIAIVAEGE